MTLYQQMVADNQLAGKSVDVEFDYTASNGCVIHVSGYVEFYKDSTSSSMDIKSVLSFHKAFGGATAAMDDFNRASDMMHEIAIAAETGGKIVNLTQHAATSEQVVAGVIEPINKTAVQAALTFDSLPSKEEIIKRATLIAHVATEAGCKKALIGGAPFLMSALEKALLANDIEPIYAFSERVSIEEPLPDGSVKKINVFKHVGFVSILEDVAALGVA